SSWKPTLPENDVTEVPFRPTNLLAVMDRSLHKDGMATQACWRLKLILFTLAASSGIALGANPYVGHWELSLPDNAAGWLGVEESGGNLTASMMMIAGSVEPVTEAKMAEGRLVLTRERFVEQKDASGVKTKKRIV